MQSAQISLFKSFIYKINSYNGASDTQEDSQKLNRDMIKWFMIVLFLSAKPMERCLKFWKHLTNCIYKHIFYVCMGYHISLLIKNSTAVFYVYILLDLTVFKGDW